MSTRWRARYVRCRSLQGAFRGPWKRRDGRVVLLARGAFLEPQRNSFFAAAWCYHVGLAGGQTGPFSCGLFRMGQAVVWSDRLGSRPQELDICVAIVEYTTPFKRSKAAAGLRLPQTQVVVLQDPVRSGQAFGYDACRGMGHRLWEVGVATSFIKACVPGPRESCLAVFFRL